MAKPNDKFYNVVKLLSSIGVTVKKTKSRFDIMRSLPSTTATPEKLK
ncbi:Lmo0850 family protein [Staphylococcus americanisciuri]|uniref:Lmo0850 family protein n=1 Tax=Staphylococcus americanisciuri TaxID=2973940 RepID=A0ABT2F3L7_9STAP|nr:Lmo0850 family protein [Staphylococcus americanisciuri]MCS4487053.1 Lmo0850 family protein [Staphylococcus americanisciuri]